MTRPSWFDIARVPEPADALFVFAGHEPRKRLGLELYRAGYAPRLILSVARFEWRRFVQLGLPHDGGLREMTASIEPHRRHFFVHLSAGETTCESVTKGRLGTMSEARALGVTVERLGLTSLLVVSSPIHLRRCRLAVETFVPAACRVVPVASSEDGSSLPLELVKLTAYGVATAFRRARNR